MKKFNKNLLSLIFCVSISFISISQNYNGSLELSSGYVYNGFGIQGNYNITLNKREYIQTGLLFTVSNEDYLYMKIPTNIFSLNVAYYNTVWKNLKQSLSWSIGIGAIGGYELVNNGDANLDNGAVMGSESKIIYGGFIGSEHDVFINDYLSLILKIQQFYHPNSDVGKFIPYGGVGLRYYIF